MRIAGANNKFAWYLNYFPIINHTETNSHWQNKCHGRTDLPRTVQRVTSSHEVVFIHCNEVLISTYLLICGLSFAECLTAIILKAQRLLLGNQELPIVGKLSSLEEYVHFFLFWVVLYFQSNDFSPLVISTTQIIWTLMVPLWLSFPFICMKIALFLLILLQHTIIFFERKAGRYHTL